MELPQEPKRQRHALGEPAQAVVERGDVAGDLAHVLQGHPRLLAELEEQEIRQRRLGPLDHRGKHRLLAHVHIEEERRVGQERRDAVEPTEGQKRLFAIDADR